MSGTAAVPRLTLGLPVYNGERFLAASLDALTPSLEPLGEGGSELCHLMASGHQWTRSRSARR